MIWKTDWSPSNDYAANGSADIDRLLSNYAAIKSILQTDFGFNISFLSTPTDGYATLPFADILNGVEKNLNALHVWAIEWQEKVVVWKTAESAPTYEDINRWEKNGLAMENAINYLQRYKNKLVAKTFYAGSSRVVQTFSRGRF